MARYRRRVSGKFAASAVAAGLILAVAQGHGHPGGGRARALTVAASGASNEALANSMAASGYGWAGSETTCLDDLWTEEKRVSAYAGPTRHRAPAGYPRSISGWSASAEPGNARQQIAWGLHYIAGRYGTPCAAWAFERSHVPNWY